MAQIIGLRHLAESLEGFPIILFIDQLCRLFLSCLSCSLDSCFHTVTLTLFSTHAHLSSTGTMIAFKIIFCFVLIFATLWVHAIYDQLRTVSIHSPVWWWITHAQQRDGCPMVLYPVLHWLWRVLPCLPQAYLHTCLKLASMISFSTFGCLFCQSHLVQASYARGCENQTWEKSDTKVCAFRVTFWNRKFLGRSNIDLCAFREHVYVCIKPGYVKKKMSNSNQDIAVSCYAYQETNNLNTAFPLHTFQTPASGQT